MLAPGDPGLHELADFLTAGDVAPRPRGGAVQRSHCVGKFERIGNKARGLREWYPEKKKRTNSDRMLPDPDNLPDHNPIEDIDQDEVQRLVKRN